MRDILSSRGLNINDSYSICSLHDESIIHLLQDCHYSASFQEELGIPHNLKSTLLLFIHNQLHINGTSNLSSLHHNISWCTLFLFDLCDLQLNQNLATFQAKPPNSNMSKDCILKIVEFHYLISVKSPFLLYYTYYICWEKPSLSCSKLNTNDLVSPNSTYAAGGGLIHDSNGNWVQAFSHAIGTFPSFWQSSGL